jgi:hypothetical protein
MLICSCVPNVRCQEFYRADPPVVKKAIEKEMKAGVYRADIPYRYVKTGSFFESCKDP